MRISTQQDVNLLTQQDVNLLTQQDVKILTQQEHLGQYGTLGTPLTGVKTIYIVPRVVITGTIAEIVEGALSVKKMGTQLKCVKIELDKRRENIVDTAV